MSDEVLQRLREIELSDVGPELDGSAETEQLLSELPALFAEALRLANGFTVNKGMNRVFGIREDRHMDIRSWNEEEGWRFAWNGKADPFLLFGETAFGDQYALRRMENSSKFEDTIYLLDLNLLSVRPVFESFDQFLDRVVVFNAVSPSHPVALACIEKFGRVAPKENIVLVPSLMLGGEEDVANMVKMESYTAMTYGGDIYTAVMSAPDEAAVIGVEPWVDDMGRQRLRVLFAEE